MRLFLAIEFDDEVKQILAQTAHALQKICEHGNFTRQENFHLTLVFLGETDRVHAIRQAMYTVQTPPFLLHIRGSGVFRRTGGDICWVGVERNDALLQVYHTLCDSLRKNGVCIKGGTYTPHLTLGREVVRRTGCDAEPDIPEMYVKVNAITLMKSERINGRLTYTPIYRKKLE